MCLFVLAYALIGHGQGTHETVVIDLLAGCDVGSVRGIWHAYKKMMAELSEDLGLRHALMSYNDTSM